MRACPESVRGRNPIVLLTHALKARLNSTEWFSIPNIPFVETTPWLRSNPEVNRGFSAGVLLRCHEPWGAAPDSPRQSVLWRTRAECCAVGRSAHTQRRGT